MCKIKGIPMALDSAKLNIFSQAAAVQGIGGAKVAVNQNPSAVIEHKSYPGDSKYGVGIVNSELDNMSYILPNGQQTMCNTIGIG